GQRRAHGLDQTVFVEARAPLVLRQETHERLAHVHAFIVGAVLGPALLAQRARDLGKGEDAAAHFAENLGAFVERNAWRHLDEGHEVAFIELWQKLTAKACGDHTGREDKARHSREDKRAPAEKPDDRGFVSLTRALQE